MGKYRFPLKKFYNIDYWTDRTNEIVKQTYSSRFWYVQTVSPNNRDYSIGTRTEFVLSNSSDIRTLSNNAKLASLKYEHKYYFVRQSMFFQRKIKPGLIEKCKSLSLSMPRYEYLIILMASMDRSPFTLKRVLIRVARCWNKK